MVEGRVYLDHAATTVIRPSALEAYTEAARTLGNPSSQHASGRRVRGIFDDAVAETKAQRDRVTQALGAQQSYGSFVWLPRGDARDVEQKVLDQGVVIRRYLDEGVRVSITNEEETTQFLEAWERAGIEPWEG